jgi:4-carboxymuconolactone decarboxylase
MARLPDIDPASLTPEQRRVYDAILNGPRGIVEGPLRVWVNSPGLADKAQALGAFCRYGTSLP